ncbi:EAL domain-containing protein [Azospirillum rugosum]|uniref:Diguanylate cyclase (GGDEF)-like protein/PAS domain S-box-containing protein n=1 Tax=Azospirillum rugosum TaxID=416170 RepID=A0ABS4SK09_9PROT|nr:EAL domain-containing protein [Azospirillum rugosum]MBP2292903.1 diguanylate cyclase (GGDEF)-like protein/PAS domain S-box-containing protein [Azospirillum rugosum]MDQ0529345.1 diguanylate cyclase (GGDEF)-like protein/PAS domain S-box-containing protein [Azospirillum rugosum]
MFDVYACLTDQHNPWLVALAGMICLFAAWTALSLTDRARAAIGRGRPLWTAAGALATGGGIWATHFVAMLAFQPNVPIGYDLGVTALSVALAVGLTGVGLGVNLRGGTLPALGGGGLLGAAIGAMHYTGMAAVRAPATLSYDPSFVAASLVIGGAGAAAALALTAGRSGLQRRAMAAGLLTAGICGLHFTAMAAVRLIPTEALLVPSPAAPTGLAAAVAAITMMILVLSLAGSIVDQRLATRAAREAARLRASETRFRQLADVTFEGIVIHAGGRILDVNRAMARLLGRAPEDFIGLPVLDFVAPSHREGLVHAAATPHEPREIALLHADGSLVDVEVLGEAIEHDGRPAWVVAVRDLRERKQAEERLRHMAHHDLLTQLPNRALFNDRLEQALALAERDGGAVAVLCLDLDRFKAVNDLLGHHGGDALLQQVAQRLLRAANDQDTVARFSGDEFVVLQTRVAQPAGAEAVAKRMVAALGAPFDLDGQPVRIGTSIGIALYPQDARAGEALLRNADTALYRAKADGRGTYRFFEAEMDARLQERRRLERDLQQALLGEQLTVHFQPLGDCTTQQIVGFEALVRWNHPERGLVAPSDFIPMAEETGLIVPLGEWVLREACREAVRWPSSIRVAVNLSPVQFRHADLAERVIGILKDTGLPPERLELEVTEGVLIDDSARALSTLKALKDAGIRISLDDFGTGYSSLSYLQSFPFDKIKIDRSFIGNMPTNEDSRAIVRAIIALARSLRITVTAEGVETEEQLRLLRSESCNQVQGYLLGRPAPADDVSARLAEPAPELVG